jgi:hypothetical protein
LKNKSFFLLDNIKMKNEKWKMNESILKKKIKICFLIYNVMVKNSIFIWIY